MCFFLGMRACVMIFFVYFCNAVLCCSAARGGVRVWKEEFVFKNLNELK